MLFSHLELLPEKEVKTPWAVFAAVASADNSVTIGALPATPSGFVVSVNAIALIRKLSGEWKSQKKRKTPTWMNVGFDKGSDYDDDDR